MVYNNSFPTCRSKSHHRFDNLLSGLLFVITSTYDDHKQPRLVYHIHPVTLNFYCAQSCSTLFNDMCTYTVSKTTCITCTACNLLGFRSYFSVSVAQVTLWTVNKAQSWWATSIEQYYVYIITANCTGILQEWDWQ